MHEVALATEIVNIVATPARTYPGATVKTVRVLVGTHSGVDCSALEFCFPLAAEGTCAADAVLGMPAGEMLPRIC